MIRTLSLVAATAASLLAVTAHAADVAYPRPSAPAGVVEYAPTNWSGFYAGIHGLYGWSDQRSSIDTGFGTIDSGFKSSGFGGGISAGYNWQWNRIVLGLEATGNWDNVKGAGSNDFSLFGGLIPGSVSAQGSLDYSMTVGPRLGYALGDRQQWLPYVGGGYAMGRASASGSASVFGFPVASFNASDTLHGWYAEAGVDYRINRTWSAKVAYVYKDLGNLDFNVQSLAGSIPVSAPVHSQAVKFGLTAHF